MPKFVNNIDLSQNQLLNAAIQVLASDPISPVAGQVYHNSVTGYLKQWNEVTSTWDVLDTGSASAITALTSDVSATGPGSSVATVNSVGGASAVNIADAVTKRHTQNTDTGTTSTTFQLDSGSSGPKLKDNGGVLEVRNAADNAYADLKVKNIYIGNEIIEVSGTKVLIGDEYIQLNDNITIHGSNSDAGINVKRLDTDDITRIDVDLVYRQSSGLWEASQPNGAGTVIELPVVRKYAASVGDGSTLSYTVTHNLGTRDIQVFCYKTASTYDQVIPDIQITTTDTITVIFAVAPTTNQYRIVVQG